MNIWTPYYLVSKNKEDSYEWGSLRIGGGELLSGIEIGHIEIDLRTNVGEWIELFDFINEEYKEYLSFKGIAIYSTDDDILYLLCKCVYFTTNKISIYKISNGGKTFKKAIISY